ncbi:3'-5' exonuclease [Caldimonas caldifontis]|uniref:DNA-directed DNA polymerase n=1 Tax=Caldimonas caldifontis TaxID=1452508 RepID=A0A2S5SRG1_9BURK|nr:exonuclease domain-containing protein [Caldimonas caldifontis]PPE65303.1 DNA polymerase III subunit epsilon [Caldimonas caldifontis]
MKFDRRFVVAVLAFAVALLSWGGMSLALVLSTVDDAQRELLRTVLIERSPLVAMAFLVTLGAVVLMLRPVYRRWITAAGRLAEDTQTLIGTGVMREITPRGSAELRALTTVINELVRQRARLREDMAQQVRQASERIEQERSRLAALMAELTQAVVVCNLDGRVLLYNARARSQFRALSSNPTLADGAELIGLGRSIYTVIDRRLVAHALDTVRRHMARNHPQPSSQFVTATPTGQLLRVQMTPVRDSSETGLGGFLLMLENITEDFEAESERDRLLHDLTEGSRASLASLRAAVEVLEDPALDNALRERFQRVIRDETEGMTRRLALLASRTTESRKTRWPLEEMLGADFVAVAQQRIESAHSVRVSPSEVDGAVWLRVDSFSLLQAVSYLAGRLVDEYQVRYVQLRLAPAGAHAHLDLIWPGQAMSTETVMGWELDPMRSGTDASPLTLREVLDRHDAEFWFERDRARNQIFFRFLLPQALPPEDQPAPPLALTESRPEYYDFDLFQSSESTEELADRRLVDLVYTVFDTETTGLEPSAGDEIIQIGAARIVNGKLLRQECFEQLVDPQRSIPAASIPIHGITPEMVLGQPTIDTVLPAFHAYARDTVLVAHNAAFDMRFLQLKEARTGVRFDQPVLDTLLLSALVHPHQESHKLEAIAERLGVTVFGRHTALGDAIVTAEIFLKLIPLLAAQGIHTLGQAREAAKKTFYARISY